MSSDNAWYVRGSSVYIVFQSDLDSYIDEAELECRAAAIADGAVYNGMSHQDAKDWAFNNYAEHGVMFIEEEDD